MKNYVQPGKTITVTVVDSGGVESGDLVVIGSLIGVAACDAAATEEVEIDTEGVFELPKITIDDVEVGELLFWDASVSKLTNVAGSGSKPQVGLATVAAGNGETTVNCRLMPTGATGPA
jgi:predicted RecA/RadA family phage recombinase